MPLHKLLTLLLLILLASACEQRQPAQTTPATGETLSRGENPSLVAEGEAVYRRVCAPCHDTGISGAPRLGEEKTWSVRAADNIESLVKRSIEGYQGNQGVMPPRGGDRYLSDEQVEAAVRYMLERDR